MHCAAQAFLLFQLCIGIKGQSISPDPQRNGTGQVLPIAHEAAPVLSTDLPSVLTSDEAEHNAEDVQKDNYSDSDPEEQSQDSSTYVVVFKDEKSRFKVMSDLNRGRELAEDSDHTKSTNITASVMSISSIPRYDAEVLQFASTKDYERWLRTNNAHIQNSCPNDILSTEGNYDRKLL